MILKTTNLNSSPKSIPFYTVVTKVKIQPNLSLDNTETAYCRQVNLLVAWVTEWQQAMNDLQILLEHWNQLT